MKKFICILIVFSLVLGVTGLAQAADAGSTKVQCNLNSEKIVVNGKSLNIRNLTYKNQVYVPVSDISGYMKNSMKLDEKNKIVNISTTGGKSAVFNQNVKLVKKLKQTLNVGINRYKITVDGLNEYMDSIYYESTVYVPVRYFFEIFDKKVEAKADGRIMVSDKTEVVSVVNGEKVSKWEFDYYYNPKVNSITSSEAGDAKKQKEELKNSVLGYINNQKIISQKIRENKINLADADIKSINTAVEQIIQGFGNVEALRKFLTDNQLYLHHVVLNTKMDYLSGKLANKMTEAVNVSESEVKKYYEENKANYTDPDMVRAKHILILTTDSNGNPVDEQKKSEAKAKAEEILKKINEGGNFDELMNSNSQDPGLQSAPTGYTFTRGQMVKEFEDAAFSLEVGKVSGIVETRYGYHILKLEEKIPSKIRTFEEVKNTVKNQLESTKKQNYLDQQLNKWKSESKIQNKI